ncbi:MAG: PQQ-binding-like beta-propeller repeat protein [Candidatus Poribacteria bacterium]|nr:PQQ-binding-like beta-propeller repeat protein [Candidatus Poribacteria bacterium]
MKHIQFFCLVLLLIALPLSAVMAELNVVWVRTGVVLEAETKDELGLKAEVSAGQQGAGFETVPSLKLDEKRVLLQLAWHPNKSYRFRLGKSITEVASPLKPVPYLIRTIELDGLLSLMENLRQPAKPTAIAVGHGTNVDKLAVATDRGHLAIVHPITGETVWKTRISEGYVRHIAFSPDNTLLYIGEQAADGFIYCYELTGAKPKLRWKYRTAVDIETSTPSNPESVYAWVSYPGQSCMQMMPNGDLLVAGVHSWTHNEMPQRRSLLYRFDAETGNVKWKWPREGTTQKIFRWFDVDAESKTLALVMDESGKGNGTLSVLDVESGTEKWHADFEPFAPYFKGVTFWRGVSMSPDGKFINVTTDDGRAYIFDVNTPEPIWDENLATPLEVSDVPIIATTGTIGATDAAALFITGDTYIPYHLQKGAQRPSTMHPNGMTLFAYSWGGEKIWQWKLENMPQGLRIDAKGRYAALAVSKRSQDPNESLHGVSVFDLTAKGSGLAKYLYTYRTEGQLPYDTLAISADGSSIAIVEIPIVMPDETLRGKNRVHVLY